MPRDKEETGRRIREAAMEEFLEKGFEGASMRGIAAKAGITAAGLYRHFTDKEELFGALVEPALAEWQAFYVWHRRESYQCLEQGDMEGVWEGLAMQTRALDVIYGHFDSFRLLLNRSRGSADAGFLHEFVMEEQRETMVFLAEAKRQGMTGREVDERELHLLLTAWSNAMFEFVAHNFTRREAEHYMKTMTEFFTPGWRALLGL